MPQLNEAGLDLIKYYEGLFLKAYLCPANVWTIGWGHTNSTGNPPRVVPGLKITKAQAHEILITDLRKYEREVQKAVKVPLNDNQYSALVSFCFNVGPGNFLKSSVLKRVNASRFDEVPARLLLWNKAAGRVLRGLTRRRKAEGDLFLTPVTDVIDQSEIEEQRRVEVEQDTGKPWWQSSTILTAILSFLTSTVTALAALETWVAAMLIVVLAGFAFWIIRERLKKKDEFGA